VEGGRLSRDSLKMVGEKALVRMRVSYSDGCRERAPSSMYLIFERVQDRLIGIGLGEIVETGDRRETIDALCIGGLSRVYVEVRQLGPDPRCIAFCF